MSQSEGHSRRMHAGAPAAPRFVGAGLRSDEIADHAQLALQRLPTLATLMARSVDPLGYRHGLQALALPQPLSRRLGRLAAEHPDLYQHHLVVAIVADFLAAGLQFADTDRQALLLAALFHDAGLADLDAMAQVGDYSKAPLNLIDAHPAMAARLLRDCPDVPEATVIAVLQHHERPDGSGYPSRLAHDALQPLGQLLAIAEAAGSVLPHRRPLALLIWLRLVRPGFRTDAIDLLVRGLHGIVLPGYSRPSESRLLILSEQLGGQAALFDDWLAQREHLRALALPDFVIERLDRIYGMLAQLGIDPQRIELALDSVADDELVTQELLALVQEIDWQLGDLLRDIERQTSPQSNWPGWRLELEALVQRLRAARGERG